MSPQVYGYLTHLAPLLTRGGHPMYILFAPALAAVVAISTISLRNTFSSSTNL